MKYEGRRLKAKAGKQFLENFSSVSLLHYFFSLSLRVILS
jgi:hypothetical protein